MTARKKSAPVSAVPAPAWPPAAPDDFTGAALVLYSDLVGRYRFNTVEMDTVHQACRTARTIELLQQHIDEHGISLTQPSGRTAANPSVSEIRQQRIALARLVSSLRLPTSDQRSQARAGVKGMYSMGGA